MAYSLDIASAASGRNLLKAISRPRVERAAQRGNAFRRGRGAGRAAMNSSSLRRVGSVLPGVARNAGPSGRQDRPQAGPRGDACATPPPNRPPCVGTAACADEPAVDGHAPAAIRARVLPGLGGARVACARSDQGRQQSRFCASSGMGMASAPSRSRSRQRRQREPQFLGTRTAVAACQAAVGLARDASQARRTWRHSARA